MKNKQEYILCAANYYNDGVEYTHNPINIEIGFITCGQRHHNCIQTFVQIVGFPYSPEAMKIHQTEIQGFLTNTNRFVDRKEAQQIAIKADQLINLEEIRGVRLYSEDLY